MISNVSLPKVKLKDKEFRLNIHSDEISGAIEKISSRINEELKGKNPLFIVVLNGAFMFASDLLKQIKVDCEVSFVKFASYVGTSSTGKVKQLIGLNEEIKIEGRHIVIVEDIVDTGHTIEHILISLKTFKAAEIKIATLLFKPAAYTKDIPVDYVAIEVGNEFLVGYGLDYDGLGRNLKDIYVLNS